MSLNVLVFGSGAREHAIAETISKSPLLGKLYLAQSGVFHLGEIIEFSDYENLAEKCLEKNINFVLIGPEEPLCEGIADIFKKYKIPCIGVNKYFSQLESSKFFAKKFMGKYGIKTAEYFVISGKTKPSGENIKSLFFSFTDNRSPIVIKANGLCKGKGVMIVYDEKIANEAIKEYLSGKFGESSKTLIVEEFLHGDEISLMSLWDGKNLLHFSPSRDFKKLNNSPDAPNTGGMGAFCPVFLTKTQQIKLEAYKKQLQNALIKEKANFTGFIYSGLIWSKNDWYVLEYNVRLGDPEAQAILTHLETDFLKILKSALNKRLDGINLKYKNNYSACLVIACEGYPENPKDGEKIILPKCQENIKIFNAGVEEIEGRLYSNGGRVLSLCMTDKNPFPILKKIAERIKMRYKYYRPDIDVSIKQK